MKIGRRLGSGGAWTDVSDDLQTQNAPGWHLVMKIGVGLSIVVVSRRAQVALPLARAASRAHQP